VNVDNVFSEIAFRGHVQYKYFTKFAQNYWFSPTGLNAENSCQKAPCNLPQLCTSEAIIQSRCTFTRTINVKMWHISSHSVNIISLHQPHPSLSVSYACHVVFVCRFTTLNVHNSLTLSHSSVVCRLWSVAVSMIRRQRTQSLSFLQAEWIPMFADCTSASIPLSQVVAYAGTLEVSSSLLVVGATHWQLGDDLAWNLDVPRGQRSGAFLF